MSFGIFFDWLFDLYGKEREEVVVDLGGDIVGIIGCGIDSCWCFNINLIVYIIFSWWDIYYKRGVYNIYIIILWFEIDKLCVVYICYFCFVGFWFCVWVVEIFGFDFGFCVIGEVLYEFEFK